MTRANRRLLSRGTFVAGAGALGAAILYPAPRAGATTVRLTMDPLGQFGATVDGSTLQHAPQALELELLAKMKSLAHYHSAVTSNANRVVLDRLPPVSEQGTPGSLGFPGTCEAQGFGYGLGTFTCARFLGGESRLDPTLRRNQPSAAWLFAQQTRTTNPSHPSCGGSGATEYMDMLVFNGSPSNRDVPYKPLCSYFDGLDIDIASYPDAKRLRIGSYVAFKGIKNQQATYLPIFRALLRAGHLIAFTGLVAKKYGDAVEDRSNGAYSPADFIPKSGHSQTIVGYDDSLGADGAFLIQNSFGTAWPGGPRPSLLQGRLWWAYESFFASQAYAAIAYPLLRVRPAPVATLHGGGPAGFILDAQRGRTVAGVGKVVLEPFFVEPVHLNTVTLREVNGNAQYAGTYNGAMRNGFVGIPTPSGFAPGLYHATLAAQTQGGSPLTYTGKLQLQ